MASRDNDPIMRQLGRIGIHSPAIVRAMKNVAEGYSPLDFYLPEPVAELLMGAASSVHLNPMLYMWEFLAFGSALTPSFRVSVRGAEVSSLAHHVNIAANIGAGKSVSTNFVKTEFYAALGGLDISESMVVNPRGSIQGITAALVKAMRTTGSALL